LASQVADRYGWGFVNTNLRPFYVEGGKTVGLEIVEQAAGAPPGHVIAPMGGGGLLVKLEQAFREAREIGLGDAPPPALYGVQAAGCAPIVEAWRSGAAEVRPVRPRTLVHSLAVGDPADGLRALRAIGRSGGRGDAPSDEEAQAGVRRLGETEGIVTEAAGGLVVSAAERLARDGAFRDGRPVVLVLTARGRASETTAPVEIAARIGGSLAEFEAFAAERFGTS